MHVFAHNGTLKGLHDDYGQCTLNYEPVGDTDSELAFCLLLERMRPLWSRKDGVFFRDSAVRLGDIRDGTSHTLFVGERPPPATFQYGWWYAGSGQKLTGSGDSFLGVEEEIPDVVRV